MSSSTIDHNIVVLCYVIHVLENHAITFDLRVNIHGIS